MRKKLIIFFMLGYPLAMIISACGVANVPVNSPQANPSSITATPTYALATPYAMQPAAGICATFNQQTVEITINADTPSPRCAIIQPDQILKVINATDTSIHVSLGNFSSYILPGGQYIIDVPFGDYLAAGVHVISVTPYFGAELWLEPSK